MQTTDSSNLFQTTTSLLKESARARKLVRAAKVGDPILLPGQSKVLRMRVRGQDCWTAESGWVARRTDLKTGKTRQVFRGHGGPCTCLAFYETALSPTLRKLEKPPEGSSSSKAIGSRTILFTGSWDRTIKAWDTDSGALLSTTPAHTDFLKSLLCIPHLDILISGSSDKKMQIWDVSKLALLDPPPGTSSPSVTQESAIESLAPLRKMLTVQKHTRPIECFVVDETSLTNDGISCSAIVCSGDSMGVIYRWKITRTRSGEEDKVTVQEMAELKGHQTSVADMVIGESGVWSASVDKTVLYHPFDSPTPIPIPHPYYVKSLLLLPATFHSTPLLLTGSTDESIRVFDISPILEGVLTSNSNAAASLPSAKELKSIEGHCHEVSALDTWVKAGESSMEAWVVSAGLDGTIRRWSIADVLHPKDLPVDVEEEKEASGLTEEEEKELADLMDEE